MSDDISPEEVEREVGEATSTAGKTKKPRGKYKKALTQLELNLLFEFVKANYELLYGSLKGDTQYNATRAAKWKLCAKTINDRYGNGRTIDGLKEKVYNIQKSAKRKHTALIKYKRMMANKTGGGPPPQDPPKALTPNEAMFLSLVGKTAIIQGVVDESGETEILAGSDEEFDVNPQEKSDVGAAVNGGDTIDPGVWLERMSEGRQITLVTDTETDEIEITEVQPVINLSGAQPVINLTDAPATATGEVAAEMVENQQLTKEPSPFETFRVPRKRPSTPTAAAGSSTSASASTSGTSASTITITPGKVPKRKQRQSLADKREKMAITEIEVQEGASSFYKAMETVVIPEAVKFLKAGAKYFQALMEEGQDEENDADDES